MRLDKLLAHSGFGTRKEVKSLLKTREVEVNGTITKDGKTHVNPDVDQITVAGEPVIYQQYIYLMLNKPQGVVSATNDNLHDTVIDLLQPQDQLQEPFPVGRLDKDTEGLLLLTNNGELAHNLLSPKKHVDKLYTAIIAGIPDAGDVEVFGNGVILEDGFRCQPAKLEIIDTDLTEKTATIQVTIHEGKFHQVKRMFEAVGKEVLWLKRLSMGPIELDANLEPGNYRPLTEGELQLLKNYL